MIVNFMQKNSWPRKIIYYMGNIRAKRMVKRVEPGLKKEDKILDIGSGTCNVSERLHKKGYTVTPLDVQNRSFVKNMKPMIYDGKTMPFNDNKFGVSIILTVLHHILKPKKTLQEAKRVSNRIIVVEDIYTNKFHKYLTYFFDSLLNLEFFGHPHSNKSDKEWKSTFDDLGLKLIQADYTRSFLFFKHATYYLEK